MGAQTLTYIHAYIIYTYIHTYLHTYIHTYLVESKADQLLHQVLRGKEGAFLPVYEELVEVMDVVLTVHHLYDTVPPTCER